MCELLEPFTERLIGDDAALIRKFPWQKQKVGESLLRKPHFFPL